MTTSTPGPNQGLAPWIGGKRNLARRLTARIEAVPHTCYAEPFIGMGGVFFRRRNPARVEALNDFSRDVSNLFRMVKHHFPALLDEIAWIPASRDEFERQRALDPAHLTEIQRAARFLLLQYQGFGGKVRTPTFGTSVTDPAGWRRARIEGILRAASLRLDGVTIENLDFEVFIRRWDRPTTLFYLDPPYFGVEDYYGKDLFARSDFERLSETLRDLKGRFLLSLNDTSEVRALFAWARIETEDVTYSVNKNADRIRRELVISSP